jgi:hypothetical protein
MLAARLLAISLAVTGCTRTWEKQVVQPNPVVHPTETLRDSEKITIVTGMMNLDVPLPADGLKTASYRQMRHYPLFNQASFSMVSRDRLRFHVQIDHTWDEYADLTTWEVKLEDDQGHTWSPESVEHVRRKVITKMWDQEQRTARCDSRGADVNGDCYNIVGFEDDGWRNRQTLGNLSIYRGNADFVFYQRDIMNTQVRWMKLTVKRSGQEFSFLWRFEEEVASN